MGTIVSLQKDYNPEGESKSLFSGAPDGMHAAPIKQYGTIRAEYSSRTRGGGDIGPQQIPKAHRNSVSITNSSTRPTRGIHSSIASVKHPPSSTQVVKVTPACESRSALALEAPTLRFLMGSGSSASEASTPRFLMGNGSPASEPPIPRFLENHTDNPNTKSAAGRKLLILKPLSAGAAAIDNLRSLSEVKAATQDGAIGDEQLVTKKEPPGGGANKISLPPVSSSPCLLQRRNPEEKQSEKSVAVNDSATSTAADTSGRSLAAAVTFKGLAGLVRPGKTLPPLRRSARTPTTNIESTCFATVAVGCKIPCQAQPHPAATLDLRPPEEEEEKGCGSGKATQRQAALLKPKLLEAGSSLSLDPRVIIWQPDSEIPRMELNDDAMPLSRDSLVLEEAMPGAVANASSLERPLSDSDSAVSDDQLYATCSLNSSAMEIQGEDDEPSSDAGFVRSPAGNRRARLFDATSPLQTVPFDEEFILKAAHARGKAFGSLKNLTPAIRQEYKEFMIDIETLSIYAKQQAEATLDDYTPQKVLLISSRVPRCDLLSAAVRPDVLCYVYDFENETLKGILETVKNLLNGYMEGAKAKYLGIVCKGGPGHMYLLTKVPVTPTKMQQNKTLMDFWRDLGALMSKLAPRESFVHLMESNVNGNTQGEKLIEDIETLMSSDQVRVQAPLEMAPQGREMIALYFDPEKHKIWKSSRYPKLQLYIK